MDIADEKDIFKDCRVDADDFEQDPERYASSVVSLLKTFALNETLSTGIRPGDHFLPLRLHGSLEEYAFTFNIQSSTDNVHAARIAAAMIANRRERHSTDAICRQIVDQWKLEQRIRHAHPGFVKPAMLQAVDIDKETPAEFLSISHEKIAGDTNAVVIRRAIEWKGWTLAEPYVINEECNMEAVMDFFEVLIKNDNENTVVHWVSLTDEQKLGERIAPRQKPTLEISPSP